MFTITNELNLVSKDSLVSKRGISRIKPTLPTTRTLDSMRLEQHPIKTSKKCVSPEISAKKSHKSFTSSISMPRIFRAYRHECMNGIEKKDIKIFQC